MLSPGSLPAAPDVPVPAASASRHPMREPAYRDLWTAYLVSNLGVWMQTVGGTWLMTTLTSDALPVALMQTATTLPAFLVGLPAGSLGDRMDRRRLLVGTLIWMFASAALLVALTLARLVNPLVLLLLTFSLGAGASMTPPIFAALLPDVVSRAQVPTAVSMNAAGFNVSRAVGPAIGGFVVAGFGPAGTFALNAAMALLAWIGVLRWRPSPQRREPLVATESFLGTMLTGLRYMWATRQQRIVLIRVLIWMLCASALWGLLPLVATRELALDATGFGLLVTCVGIGAVAGSLALPHLRRRWPGNGVLLLDIGLFAAMCLTLAWVRLVPVVCVMLALGGAAWTTSNQNFQIAVQMNAPAWVRARAIAAYLLAFQGGQAVGSALWGAVAERAGDPFALTLAAIGLALGMAPAIRWPIQDGEERARG